LIHQISADRIIPALEAGTKQEVLLELATLCQRSLPGIEIDTLFSVLWEREMLGSTGVGDGIALPHGKIGGIDRIEICFGRSGKGIAFDSVDNKSAHLFFLLLAPTQSASPYLRCLAQLSRFLKNPHIRSRLTLAENVDEIMKIFAEAKELI
jgi:PTS system nitrogen regulatory IIA component